MKDTSAARRMTGRAAAGLLMLALGAAVGAGLPATAPAGRVVTAAAVATGMAASAKSLPAGPTVNVAVSEWAVFVTDVSHSELNRGDAFTNMLPLFSNDTRKQADTKPAPGTKDYGPIGMIRVTPAGMVNTDLAIDIQLSYPKGRALGEWPGAEARTSGVLWKDVHFAGPKETVRELASGSWLADARQGGSARNIVAGSTAENFLLYDLELDYPVKLQVVSVKPGVYKVAQHMDVPMQNLTFYKGDGNGGWRTAAIESLSKAGKGGAKAGEAGGTEVTATMASPPASQAAPHEAVKLHKPTSTQPGNETMPAEAASTTKPAVTLEGGTDVVMGTESIPEARVMDSWRAVLAEQGVSAGDQDLILKILGRCALDPKRLTAVYRLDADEFDKILPLEVVPTPKKISRVALVVVTGIDPATVEEVDQLIAQLGDKSWEKREAAMTELRKMGTRAKSQLEKAVKNKDVEVVYRAEQLLQILLMESAPPVPKDQ